MLRIDADAHVLETEKTWEYMEGAERKFRPQVVGSNDGSSADEYWLVDGTLRCATQVHSNLIKRLIVFYASYSLSLCLYPFLNSRHSLRASRLFVTIKDFLRVIWTVARVRIYC